jgi:hypothetical protein
MPVEPAPDRIGEEALPLVEAQRVTRPPAIAARAGFGTDLTRVHATPLVGRQIDLGILSGAFQKSLQESIVQLVTVVGEPGVGKSRLVAELFSLIDAMPDLLIPWRQGRCLPYGDAVTFWALGEILKAEAGILETDGLDVAGQKIDAIVPEDHPDAPWLRQRLRPLIGLEAPSAARDENFAAWRGFLESLAETRPSVFFFEDLGRRCASLVRGVPGRVRRRGAPSSWWARPGRSCSRGFPRGSLRPATPTGSISRRCLRPTAERRIGQVMVSVPVIPWLLRYLQKKS